MAREMKDSGIEWIGEIPKEWQIVKMNIICSVITDYVASGSFASLAENVKYLDEPDYAMLIRTADVSRKGHVGKPVYINEHAYNFLKNSNLFGGEIILPNIGGVGEAYIVPKLYDKMSLAPNSIMIRTNYEDKYYYYFFNCEAGARALKQISQSTAQEKFNKTDFRQIRGLIPLLREQKRIAAYLDAKCVELDNILSKTRASIEEYKKLKQAVITQAVTKGIRGDREMKDSYNIRWGKIPSDWGLIRIKNCIIDLKSGLSSVTNDENAGESGYYVLRTSAVSSGVFLPKEVKPVLTSAISRLVCPVEKDTIVVSRMNTSAMVGTCAYVDNEYPGLFLPDKLWKIHIKRKYYAKYFWYVINSIPARSLFDEISTGASMSMQNISVTDFVNNYVTVPSLNEQREIVHYLDQKCSAIDDLIIKKEQYIFEIENYKKSLIYEYVTGKKEVPQEKV